MTSAPTPTRGRHRKKAGTRPWWSGRLSLPKAASITLILAGAAVTALPGSPIRAWMMNGWQALFGAGPAAVVQPQVRDPGSRAAPSPGLEELGAGASIPAGAEAVEIWVFDLPAEAELRVRWVEEGPAWVRAGEATRFNLGPGRLEAHGPPGSVQVDIPRSVSMAVVGLDGRVLLRKSGEDVEVLEPVRRRSPSEVVFQPTGVPNEGQGPGVSNP